MKLTIFKVTVAALVIFSSSLASAWSPSYDYMTRDQFLALDSYSKSRYHYAGLERGHPVYVCTDSTSRRVPGKLIDGFCYVPWSGKEYRNTDYYVLLTESWYTWRPSVWDSFFMQHTPSPVGHHCRVKEFHYGSVSYSVGKLQLIGSPTWLHYVCTISWKSKTYDHYVDDGAVEVIATY